MRWPALWPSGTALRAACTMFSAQPKAKASSASRSGAPVCDGGQREGHRPGRCRLRGGEACDARASARRGCAATRPASGPSARSAGAARCFARLSTQSFSASIARQVARARRRRPAPRTAGRRGRGPGAAGRAASRSALASSRRGRLRPPLQAFGIAEATDRQGRRGQPHQLQQWRRRRAVAAPVLGAWPRHRLQRWLGAWS